MPTCCMTAPRRPHGSPSISGSMPSRTSSSARSGRRGGLTGRPPAPAGIYANEPLWAAPARPAVFIETLKAAGYQTFGAGKVLHGRFDYTSATGERALQAEWREVQNRPFLWDEF